MKFPLFKGKAVDTMSREELIDTVVTLGNMYTEAINRPCIHDEVSSILRQK